MPEDEQTVDCTDAFGRRRKTYVSATDQHVCVRVPAGEVACYDWHELDRLIATLTELRRRHREL